jgi:glycine/D-amino acid oxidase-like deaminating enzyme
VGGGVTGAATAWYLARAGAQVTLVERDELGAASSGANAGSLHAQIQHATYVERGDAWARDYAPATRFLLQSIELWRSLSDDLAADLEVSLSGGLLVAETQDQMRLIERKVAIEREQGLTPELLSAGDLRERAPYLAADLVGGELCPQEGKANPLLATAALARAAAAAGARILTGTTVHGLTREGAGFVAHTSAGPIAARRVVSCGGIEAGAITAMLGAPQPITGMAIQASVTEVVTPLVGHLLYYAGGPLTLKQARAGSILIGGGWPARVRDGAASVDPDSLLSNLALARRVVPALQGARLLRTWAGYVNASDSWLPLIGELASVPGLFIGAFPFMGFTAGPLVGRVLSELVCGRPAGADISDFAPAESS